MSIISKQLEIVTKFSKHIGMHFDEDKCACLRIEKGTIIKSEPIEINQLKIQPTAEKDCYRYLGFEENISYNGMLNKEKVTKEYWNRVRKIWSSELSDYNKVIAHNSFAITPAVGIVDWTIDDIDHLDVKTRKILSMSGNFHPYSDID